MTMDRLNADFARIFGDYERVFAAPEPTIQKKIESGTHIRAAVKRPALCLASDPTRGGNTHEGEIGNV